jgi:hypothetical protein
MTEQTAIANTISDAERAALDNSFDHAMKVLLDAQHALSSSGIDASVLASALCASYVTYVSALVAVSGLPKEDVARVCKGAIDTMPEFISIAFDRMVGEIEKEAK